MHPGRGDGLNHAHRSVPIWEGLEVVPHAGRDLHIIGGVDALVGHLKAANAVEVVCEEAKDRLTSKLNVVCLTSAPVGVGEDI